MSRAGFISSKVKQRTKFRNLRLYPTCSGPGMAYDALLGAFMFFVLFFNQVLIVLVLFISVG